MPKEPLDTQQAKERFQQYLFEMSDVLEQFIDAAETAGYSLDGSLESLDELERHLLTVENTVEDRERLVNRAASYFGEVVRKRYGGKWKLSLESPKSAFYGFPILVGHSRFPAELCPIRSIRTFLNSRKQGLLRQIVENHVNPQAPDLTPEA